MSNEIHIASGPSAEDGALPPQLFAGDTPAVVTQDHLITVSGNTILQHTPLKLSSGNFVPWTSGSEVAAIAAFDLPVGTYRKVLYDAGMFNIDAINWPAGTTEVQAEAGLTGMIRARKLLYSGKRTGNESQYVGPGNEAGGQPLSFTGGTITGGTEAAVYSYDLDQRVAGGSGARTWSLTSGSLPSGVTLNTSTGVISGTVGGSAVGTYSPVFKVMDAQGNESSATITIVIAAD